MKATFRMALLMFVLCAYVISTAQTAEVLLPVKVNKKWGYINLKGEMKIEPQFDAADEFNGKAIARATLNNKLVLINKKGEVTVEPDLKRVTILSDSIYAGTPDNVNWGIYKIPYNEIISPRFTSVQNSASPNYFYVFKNIYLGLVDLKGKIVVEPRYEKITIRENYFMTYANTKYGACNKKGKEILQAQCNQIVSTNYDYLFFEFNSNWGCITFSGDSILKPEHRKLQEISNGFIKVTDHNEKIYSIKKKKTIFDNFKGNITSFNDSLLYLNRDNLYGIGNDEGEILFNPVYQNIFLLGNDYFLRRKDSVGIYSGDRKEIVPIKYKSIIKADSQFYIAQMEDIEALYSNTGKLIVPAGKYIITTGDGRIKLKSRDKIEMYKVKDNFVLEKDDEFMNVVTVSIRKRVDYGDNSRNVIAAPTPVTVAGGWFMNIKSKYGKVNANGDTIVKPIFDYYREYLEKDMAIVGVYQDDRFNFEISGHKYSYSYYVGLIQNSTGKFYARPEYCYIDVESIKDTNFITTMGINRQGLFCFIVKGRRPILKQFAFIDTASDGLMRYCEDGRLTTMPNIPSKANYLCTLSELLQRIGVMNINWSYESKIKVYVEGGKWGFWSVKRRMNIAPQYQFVSPMYANRSIVKQHNRFGLIDEQNRVVLSIEYFKIELLSGNDFSNFKVWRENSNYGYINKKGETIITPVYTNLSLFKEGYCVARNNEASRFVDTTGNLLNDSLYKRANNFSEGIASVKKDYRWGFINKKGEWILRPKYKNAGSFGNGLAPVKYDQTYGYINKEGKVIIKFNYMFAADFIDGIARVRKRNGKYGYINTKGNYLIRPTYFSASDFDQYGLARVTRFLGTSSFIHRNGNKANYFRFYKAGGFSEDRNILSRINNFAIMDTSGKIIRRYKNVSRIYAYKNGYAVVIKKGKYGIIDKEGNYVIKPAYKYLSDVNENGLLVFGSGRKKGVINLKGQIILEPKYVIVGGCEHNILLLKDGKGEYYYTDIKAIPIVETHFQIAKPFSDGVSKVYINNNWALINERCIMITNPKYGAIKKMNPSLYKVEVDYFYGIVDANGNFIIEPNYDFVSYTNDNVFRVENGDQVGYISKGGKWIWRTRN